jgi:hypothetical protein
MYSIRAFISLFVTVRLLVVFACFSSRGLAYWGTFSPRSPEMGRYRMKISLSLSRRLARTHFAVSWRVVAVPRIVHHDKTCVAASVSKYPREMLEGTLAKAQFQSRIARSRVRLTTYLIPAVLVAIAFATGFCPTWAAESQSPVLPSHDSAYWIARFEREYPAAAEALQKAVSKVRCAGEYITPGMGLNAHRTRDQSARMHFEIFRNGDLLRWSRKCTDPSVPPDVMVLNQSEAFLLRSTMQRVICDSSS